MPGPVGNKNAQKGEERRTKNYQMHLAPSEYAALKAIAEKEEMSVTDSILYNLKRLYPSFFKK